jgi:Ankyrin repeats (3 copies)
MAQEWLGTLLHRALRDRHIDEVRRFALAGADLEVHNEMGQTPLYVAAAAGMDKAVKVLLGFGADVEAVDSRGGHPPIHIASSRGHEEVARLLLEHGADIDYRDPDQWTALHQAVHFGYIETARLLFDRGADWTIRTTDDKMTVLERATQRGRIEIILMLAHLSDNQNKELCQKCLGITIPDLLQPEKEGEVWLRSGYLHHSSEESLKQSARNCNGCLLITRSLDPKPEGKEYPGSIRLRAYSYKDPDLSYECITTVTAVVDTGGREGGLDLAADEGECPAVWSVFV